MTIKSLIKTLKKVDKNYEAKVVIGDKSFNIDGIFIGFDNKTVFISATTKTPVKDLIKAQTK